MQPDMFDVSTAARFSPIDPMSIRRIVSCYRQDISEEDYIVGFVAELPSKNPLGRFAYVVLTVEPSIAREGVTTQYFYTEPDHLYSRAVDWHTGGPIIAEINESLGYSKANAKNGSSSSAFDQADGDTLFRVQG